jgi:hypothetical protein
MLTQSHRVLRPISRLLHPALHRPNLERPERTSRDMTQLTTPEAYATELRWHLLRVLNQDRPEKMQPLFDAMPDFQVAWREEPQEGQIGLDDLKYDPPNPEYTPAVHNLLVRLDSWGTDLKLRTLTWRYDRTWWIDYGLQILGLMLGRTQDHQTLNDVLEKIISKCGDHIAHLDPSQKVISMKPLEVGFLESKDDWLKRVEKQAEEHWIEWRIFLRTPQANGGAGLVDRIERPSLETHVRWFVYKKLDGWTNKEIATEAEASPNKPVSNEAVRVALMGDKAKEILGFVELIGADWVVKQKCSVSQIREMINTIDLP